LHKSQSWAIVGGKKERGLRDGKKKQERKVMIEVAIKGG